MALDDVLLDAEEKMLKSEQHVEHEFSGVRTGKASPALVENIQVGCHLHTSGGPLSALLRQVWERYGKPLIVAETGHIGRGRAEWLLDIAGEARAYEKAVALDPRYVRAHFNLAVAYDDLGRGQDALKHYDLAILYEPTAVDAVQNRALLLVTLGYIFYGLIRHWRRKLTRPPVANRM